MKIILTTSSIEMQIITPKIIYCINRVQNVFEEI